MLGVFVNTATVLVGSLVGVLMKKGIPERVSQAVMIALGLFTLYMGFDGGVTKENSIVLVLSIVFGTLAGTLIDIDGKLNKVGNFLEKKMKKKEGTSIAEGFVSGSLLFCIGAMTIVGSLNSGLKGDHTIILTKSVMDLFSSCMLASSLGIGVMFSAIFVFVFQGALVLLLGLLQNVMGDPLVVQSIGCAGSIMIIGIGLNLVGIKKVKIADMLPAIFFVPLFFKVQDWVIALFSK